jgi:hypothetical protein
VVRVDRGPGHARPQSSIGEEGSNENHRREIRSNHLPGNGGWTGALSVGFGPDGKRTRIKKKGRTKAAVKEKLVQAAADLDAGIKAAEGYTVADAVNDWLSKGLKGRDESTISTNRILADKHVLPLIGARKLKQLTADEVDNWLDGLTDKLATRSLRGVHSILKRAIRQAQARDKVLRNVAELVTTPKGKEGRPSKALTLEQATAVLDKAKTSRLHAYVVLSLMTRCPHRGSTRSSVGPRRGLGGWQHWLATGDHGGL